MERFSGFILAFAVGCNSVPNAAPADVTTAVSPGGGTSLAAALATALSCPVTSIVWSVVEGSTAGSITSTGVYTAPGCGSPFIGSTVHVNAAGCGRSATAAIAISEDLGSVTIAYAVVNSTSQPGGSPDGGSAPCLATDPANVAVLPGESVQYYSALNFTCGPRYSPPLPATGWPPPGC